MKRFLRPALGIAAALAVGVAAVFVGIQFAPPQTVSVPAQQVEAPVLAPIAEGPDEPDADAVSESVGTKTITVGGTAPTDLPDDLLETIETIESADDPALAVTVHEDAEAAASAGDPCAPAEGEAPADCPSGLHSTILALEGVRTLYVAGEAFPQTQEEYQASSTFTLYPWCPAVEYAEGEVPFGIFSTAPADFQVTYWPTANPADVSTATATTSTTDRAAYSAAQAAGTDPYEMPFARNCLLLTELEPNTAYTAEVRAEDVFGRTNTPRQVWFNSGGELGVPAPEVTTLGDNVVFASVLHTEDERAVIHGILMDTAGADEPNCDGSWTPSTLIHESERTVSAEYLLDRGVLPEYTERTNATYLVPEGSTFVICARVYPAGEGVPSWEAATPDRETVITIHTPDYVRPTVTVENLEIQRGSTVVMEAATTEGIPCGNRLANREYGYVDGPFDLCSSERITGIVVLADELRNYGHNGDIAITSAITPQGGSPVTKSTVLSLGVHRCATVCPTPVEQWFRLALGDDGLERALIHVIWEQGNSNGVADWVISQAATTSPDYVRPEKPDFDRDAALDDFQINWEQKNVSLAYTLAVDRPVDYTVAIVSDLPDATLPCYDGPSPLYSVSGHADETAALAFHGLCLGTQYQLEVTLTDADGQTVSYGTKWSDTDYANLPVRSPGWDGELVWQLHVAGPDHSVLTGFSASVAGTPLFASTPRDTLCEEDGVIDLEGTTEVTLSQDSLVAIDGTWTIPPTWTASGCRGTASIEHRTSIWQTVSIDQIQWGAPAQGVWIHVSDGYGSSLHLWMDDFR